LDGITWRQSMMRPDRMSIVLISVAMAVGRNTGVTARPAARGW
jgi:hypothetical protein